MKIIINQEKITGTHFLFLVLFLIGVAASALFAIWLISGFAFILGDATYPGDIAFVPKWIFFLIPLVVLGYTRKIRELEKIILG